MTIQRSATTRRGFLAGALAAGAGVAGCVGGAPGSGTGTTASGPVSVLSAGSLHNALVNGLVPSVGSTVQVESHGSARCARMVAEGQKDPDVLSLADTALFDGPLHPDWYAEFATNSVVLAYNPATEGGQRVAEAGVEGWYEPLLSGDVALGRTDPDLDPLGYRSLFVLELATGYYGTDADLRAAIPDPDQLYPETQLVSRFETGAIDAALTYRNMAVERDYDYVDLPAEIDLSDPRYADRYADATYTLPDGKTVRGGLISYGTTVFGDLTDAVAAVFAAQLHGDYLSEFGFVVPDDYPRYTGDVPDRLA